MTGEMTIALAQIAPAWFDREATLTKVSDFVSDAADKGASIVGFGEGLVPGYPFWIEYSGVTEFNSSFHKSFHAAYIDQAVCIERGDLAQLAKLAAQRSIAVYLGVIERPADRGESLYASIVYIDAGGRIASVHRKLMPTYDERMTWSIGDGHGLRTHTLGTFTVGGLNCWENWMPLARTALYSQGEDLHFAIWPGSKRNTSEITRFIALESRSFVASVSGLMRKVDLPDSLPGISTVIENAPDVLADGGSCVAAPDGSWIVEPVCLEERLILATLDHERVRQERQNFDPTGHYSRPDVLRLTIDRTRQSQANFIDD